MPESNFSGFDFLFRPEPQTKPKSNKLDFDDVFRYILDVEGGYSNDAGDPGGPTKYGINRYDAPYLRELGVPNIQSITPDHAKQIYQAKYWNQGWAGLPAPSSISNRRLAVVMFDTAVNPRQSVVKSVQRIFANPNLTDDQKADEIIQTRTQNYQGAKPQFVKGLTNRMAKLSSFVGSSSPSANENSAFSDREESEEEERQSMPDFSRSLAPKPRPRAQPATQPQGWRARTAADNRQIGYGTQNQGIDVRRVQAEIDRLRGAKKNKIAEINKRLVNAQNNHVIANVRSERRELSNIDSAIKTLLNKLSPPPSAPNGPPVYIKRLPKNVQGPLEVMKPYEYENTAGSLDFLHLNDISKIVKPASQPAKLQALDFTKLAQPPTPPQRQLTDYEKRENARREFDNRKIRGYETATGPIQIVVKLPVSGTVVPATFKKAPTNGQMRDWIREHDRIASLQRGIAHPDIRDQFDKLDTDAVEVANAIRYGSKSVKTKGGDGQVRLQWAAERVAKILGIRDVKKLMQRGTPEYKFFNHFVSQLGYTPDSDDVNFRDAGIDAGTAGIIKRNPGIAYDNGWDTYMRGLRSALSPSDIVSIMGGDTRSQDEIDHSTINVLGFDVNEGVYRGAADLAVNVGASILTGGVAGLAKSGVEGMSKGVLKSLLLAGGKQASGRAAFKTLVSSAASMAEKKAASAVLLQNGLRSLTTNVAQNAPGVFTGARDIQATTGKSYWDSLKQSTGDAAMSQLNQYDFLDEAKSDAERAAILFNLGVQASQYGIGRLRKVNPKRMQIHDEDIQPHTLTFDQIERHIDPKTGNMNASFSFGDGTGTHDYVTDYGTRIPQYGGIGQGLKPDFKGKTAWGNTKESIAKLEAVKGKKFIVTNSRDNLLNSPEAIKKYFAEITDSIRHGSRKESETVRNLQGLFGDREFRIGTKRFFLDNYDSLEEFEHLVTRNFRNGSLFKDELLTPRAVSEFGLHNIENVRDKIIDPRLKDHKYGQIAGLIHTTGEVGRGAHFGVPEHPGYPWQLGGTFEGYVDGPSFLRELLPDQYREYMIAAQARYERFMNLTEDEKRQFMRNLEQLRKRGRTAVKSYADQMGMQTIAPQPRHFDMKVAHNRGKLWEIDYEGVRGFK